MSKRGKSGDDRQLLLSGAAAIDPELSGLPGNPFAERLILGSAQMNSQQFMPLLVGHLSPEHFTLEKHKIIFRRMLEMYESGRPIDRVSLAHALKAHGELESVDGISYLLSLDEGLPHIVNLETYIDIVREERTKRRIIEASQAAINMCLMRTYNSSEILEKSSAMIQRQMEESSSTGPGELISEIIAESGGIDQFLATSLENSFRVPWSGLHRVTGYLRPGQLILIAARPACGKTLVGLQLAANLASRYGPCGFHTLEVDRAQLVRRLLSAASRVEYELIETGDVAMTAEQKQRVKDANARLESTPIRLVENCAYTVPQLRSWILRQKNRPKFVFIDYLQLMSGMSTSSGRNEEVGGISRGLKRLARELGIVVVALVQLNRLVEMSPGGIPELHHLRESGNLEQDADKVLMLHRPSLYSDNPSPELESRIDIYVRKNRQGRTGKCELNYQGDFCRVADRLPATAEQAEEQRRQQVIVMPEPPSQRMIDIDPWEETDQGRAA